jgi:hypothetical protein
MNQHIQRIPSLAVELTVASMLCPLAATHAHAADSSITLYGLFDTFVAMLCLPKLRGWLGERRVRPAPLYEAPVSHTHI